MTARDTGGVHGRVPWIAAATMVAALYALLVAWTGGFDWRLGGARIRSTEWERPALAAAWALTAGLLFGTFANFQASRYLMDGEVAGQAGNDHPVNIPMGVFPTADKPITSVAVPNGAGYGLSPYFRVSFASSLANLEEACRRIDAAARTLH